MCRFVLIVAIFSLNSWVTLSLASDNIDARLIMTKVDTRDNGDNQTSDMEMILINKLGSQRIFKIHALSKNQDKGEQRIMFFMHPREVKDTGFLTYDYHLANKNDDQWLYLPSLGKIKHIQSADKSRRFMGSDFSYADMINRKIEDYDYSIKKEMQLNGKDNWVIEALPRSTNVILETGYTKSLLFVRKDNFVIVRSIHWVKKGKQLKYIDMKGLKLIDNIWSPTEIHVTLKKAKTTLHKTILKIRNIKFNQSLNDNLFTLGRLEKGL